MVPLLVPDPVAVDPDAPASSAPLTLAPPSREGLSGLSDSLSIGLNHPDLLGRSVSMVVHVEDLGPALVRGPELDLLPASNQKLLTALAALEILGPERTFITLLGTTAPPFAGVIDGDLVLFGGADPGLELDGPDSIGALADQLSALGVTRVTGQLVLDESRHPTARTIAGWKPGFIPGSIGPLSSLSIGSNRIGSGEEYWFDPMATHGQLVLDVLSNRGITVDGGSRVDTAPRLTLPLAGVQSESVADLIDDLLGRSDNEASELLVREMGLAVTGEGTTEAGVMAMDELFRSLMGESDGVSGDGSGLSNLSRRSAHEWVRLLRHVESSPWNPLFEASLARGAESGTLRNRYFNTAGALNVRAKTGTTDEVRSLSGRVRTLGGRNATFSIIVNGDDLPRSTRDALDALVVRIAGHPG